MEIHFPSLFLLVSFFVSTFFFVFKFEGRRRKSTRNLPPGPRKLPLIGNLHNLIGSVPHRSMHQLARKHGPLMHLQLGELSAVIISSPDAAKEIMRTHDLNFASRPPILVAEIMGYSCTSITFGPYGDYWRQLRRICTLELLSAKRVQSFRALRERVFADLVRRVASAEGFPVDLTKHLHSKTYALTAEAVLGELTEEREALVPIIKEVAVLAAGFDVAELYPSVKLFRMMSSVKRRLTELHREMDRIFEEIIDDHRAAIDSGKSNSDGSHKKQEDLIDVLLRVQEEGLEIPLTTDNIKAVMLDVLGAGSETSATVMDWAMAEMLKNPETLMKAQQEVRQVFDGKGYVDESNIHEIKYLKSVIKEILRLHPPLPLILPRICGKTVEINGYTIPENTKVIVNAWAINRDPQSWNDADSFQPERFLDNSVDFRGNHFEFIPFGAGRRICPGMNFGLANIELPLAMLLYHFDWKLADGEKHEKMDMEDGFGATARRIRSLSVIPVIERPLPPFPT